MKKLIFVLMFGFLFSQVPDSVIVNKIAELKAEHIQNADTIAKNIEINNNNYARQNNIVAQVQVLEALLKKEEIEGKE